ncbi:alcohol dehydrogenase catalytic domain-containing protein [Herbiconiux daphne]|uniref:alcohol dehydrogenase n=1 Tax=Herbiconiux daphne TaxID=2970914 RepID=A0ABT2H728_9MICO|nr:alcohol dehydrogenase catalytic domain-containing protein [Herbiconiux daphne]MCS5735740.1 alcohol dehydrogenase catalytic domain-containing protein [Herbiconiux daphne]
MTERIRLPSSMSAVVMREFGGPEVLRVERVATPSPRTGEVIVRVAAVEVSRTRDSATRSGNHPFSRMVELPHILGGHFAGTVASVGSGVDPEWIGRRVGVMNYRPCTRCERCRAGAPEDCARPDILGINWWGSYAQFAAVPVTALHHVPEDLDLVEAAALAATGPVALAQLRAAGAEQGKTILITGITGALGSVIAELGIALGAHLVGLSRRPDALRGRVSLAVVDANAPDLGAAISASTGGIAPHAVIDNVCAPDVFMGYWPILGSGARVVISGAIGNPELPVLPVPARDLYSRNLSILGVRSHSADTAHEFWDFVRSGFRLRQDLIQEYALEDARAAHLAIQDGSSMGHTVLRVGTAGSTVIA